jgi:hypothetical protein
MGRLFKLQANVAIGGKAEIAAPVELHPLLNNKLALQRESAI